jgi:hypothetical protein
VYFISSGYRKRGPLTPSPILGKVGDFERKIGSWKDASLPFSLCFIKALYASI